MYAHTNNNTNKLNKSMDVNKIMQVYKRNGNLQDVSFDKIHIRLQGVAKDLGLHRVNTFNVAKETIEGLRDRILTEELDIFAAKKCADKISKDPQYNKFAAGILISNLHKTTSDDFMKVTEILANNVDVGGNLHPLVCDRYYQVVKKNIDVINKALDYKKDYLFDYFGFKTLEIAYLYRVKNVSKSSVLENLVPLASQNKLIPELKTIAEKGRIIERPQHLLMRVALGIYFEDIEKVLKCYYLLSDQYFTHASPTLYNAGSIKPQMSSCFLLNMNDSIEGIFNETISEAANISKWSGGIGIHMQAIRAKGSYIRGTNGTSDGIIPLMKVLNETGRYVNQGGRRKGAIAVYLEPWHPDIYEFCELKKNGGVEELRARDMFTALWIPDLFMKRVLENGLWSLMCPDKCPGLDKCYGKEFEELYFKYETEKRYNRQVHAGDLWNHIISCQLETGVPYILFKDNANYKSNQKNIGVLRGSNLCTEILEVANSDETAVCNLASLCLPKYIITDEKGNKIFDHDKLLSVTRLITENLNNIIDINFYPSQRAINSNLRHRPIGIGVQGLADVFCIMNYAYDSLEAAKLSKEIFETIYYGALLESNNLAKIHGHYSSFPGSPFSQGILQWHEWGLNEEFINNSRYNWVELIENIKKYGVRNSLLTTIMPTASTSQIMGNNEAVEPYTYNLYKRSTMAGAYVVINAHLIEKLIELNLWNDKIRNTMIYDNGSVQYIPEIPDDIKNVFKTSFELGAKPIIQMAINIAPFVDQSHSLNLFFNKPDTEKLHRAHFYSWQHGLKTGMYYLHSQPSVNPLKFGIDEQIIKSIEIERIKYNLQHNTNYPIRSAELDIIEEKNYNRPNCGPCSG